MAYVLLATGALMAALGLYGAITGYRIVQVEEGWASLIAGTTLFTGGLLMMGLGLAVRTLTQVVATLRVPAVPLVTPEPAALAPHPEFDPLIGEVDPDAIEPNAVAPSAVFPPSPPSPSLPTPAPFTKREPEVEPSLRPPHPPSPPRPPSPPPFVAPPRPTVAPRAFEPVAIAPEQEPAPTDDTYQLETPSTADHDLVRLKPKPVAPAPAPEPPASEVEPDWLDRAFAEFDRDLPRPKPGPGPAQSVPLVAADEPTAPPAPEPVLAETAPPSIAPSVAPSLTPSLAPSMAPPAAPAPRAPAPSAPPPLSGPASTVIGRYESEGTSYVMYADGSIEAQSANGVYRFASMAELKAFIEG